MDGNFDNGFTGWTLTGNTGFASTVSITPPRQDSTIKTAAQLGAVGSDGILTQPIAGTRAGQCYQLSFLLENLGNPNNDFSVVFDGMSVSITGTPDGITVPVTLPGDGPFDFNRFTTTVTATGSDMLQFLVRQDPSFFRLTGVSLTPCAGGGASLPILTVLANVGCLLLE